MHVPRILRRSRRGVLALAASSVTLASGAAVAASALAAGTATQPARTSVPAGITPAAVPGAQGFGSTAADTPETVSFVLKETNASSLESKVDGGFKNFLSVSQFASDYGQPKSYLNALTSYLAGYGIKTTVYPDDINIDASGTAGEFDSALKTSQENYTAPARPAKGGQAGHAAQSFHGATTSPSLPSDLADQITAIFGLTSYSPFDSNTSHINTSLVKPAKSPASSPAQPADSSTACEALSGLPQACHLPQDFAKQYNLTGLQSKGAAGQGETLAIVTLAALDPSAPSYYWSKVEGLPASGRSVKVDNIDGGPGAPSDASGSGETDLDVEQSGGLAPDANVIVYQAPNTDQGFSDAYFEAASQNTAASVSSSWGESETLLDAAIASGTETSGYEAAFDEAFLEFAAQGQSAFTAAGDAGAYDASDDLGSTNLSLDTSSDSPYITAAGGTTLPWSGTLVDSATDNSVPVGVSAQRAWGWDYLWAPIAQLDDEPLLDAAEANIGGGGGGFSVIEPEPSYQKGVRGTTTFRATQWLTPTGDQDVGGLELPTSWMINPSPSVSIGNGSGRATPDVSTDADPYSGYLLYEPSFSGVDQPTLQGGWGGTSFVAPQLNGSTAVIDSYLGRRVGFWNPTLYADASGSDSATTPLDTAGTSNDNLYFTGNPGSVFNPASGLGTPNLTKLASDF